MSNIDQLNRAALADRVTWTFDAVTLEATDYAQHAKAGNCDYLRDALSYNEDRTIRLVDRLAMLDRSPSMTGDQFREAFRVLLSDLIDHAAADHAAQCNANGRL